MTEPSSLAIAGFSDLKLGSDLVYVPRLRNIHGRFGLAFFRKLLTEVELSYCQGGHASEAFFLKRAAGRIAVKEAVAKALGCGLNGLGWGGGLPWREIEVLSQAKSPPTLQLHGRAFQVSAAMGVRQWRFSLSHDGDYALATAIGLI